MDLESREVLDESVNNRLTQQFKLETGADFDVHLFARRQDMDDFAFSVVQDGIIEDKVVYIHLSFAQKRELSTPLKYENINRTFWQWIKPE